MILINVEIYIDIFPETLSYCGPSSRCLVGTHLLGRFEEGSLAAAAIDPFAIARGGWYRRRWRWTLCREGQGLLDEICECPDWLSRRSSSYSGIGARGVDAIYEDRRASGCERRPRGMA